MGAEIDIRGRVVIDRVLKSFGVPMGERAVRTVGELVGTVAVALRVSPDDVLAVQRYPSVAEREWAAWRKLCAGLREVGIRDSGTMDAETLPGEVLPRENRSATWKRLAAALDCELPLLQPPRWRFGAIFGLAYAAALAGWVGLLYAWGLDTNPTTPWAWVGAILFTVVMFFGTLMAAAGMGLLLCPRTEIEFRSMGAFAGYVEAVTEGLGESLVKEVECSARAFVVGVVAEEFEVAPETVGDGFRLRG